MSIIIRLQNLPWNANAADIRQFFQNLTIPDGGVHIVGGENGDAFIAFGSDEDARQAMLLDGGKIKDSKIKLLLSSRTEMQKVIESARQQALTLQNLMQSMAAASTFGASPLSMLPNVLTGMSSVLPNLSSLPSAVASSASTASTLTIPAPPTSVELKELKSAASTEPKTDAPSMKNVTKAGDNKSSSKSDNKTGSNSRSRSRSRSGSKSVSKSRSRSRSRSHSRSRSRDRRYRDKYRYGSSGGRSRDRRWRRDRSRSKDRSRSRDRYRRRSRSKDRRSRDQSGDIYKSRDKRRSYDKKEKSPTNDDRDRTKSRRNSDGKSKPLVSVNVDDTKLQRKNDITFLKVSPVPDTKTSGTNEPSTNESVSSIVAQLLAKTKAATPSSRETTSAASSNTSMKFEPAPDTAKIDIASQKNWMGAVPMPPMISPWMISQTAAATASTSNEAAVAPAETKVDKNAARSETAAKANENVALSMPPFGMYPSQFHFGTGFPPPPSMYPFAGYPTTTVGPVGMPPAYVRGTVDQVSPMSAAAAPPISGSHFNPYQHVAAINNEPSGHQASKTPHSVADSDKRGRPSKLPRLENHDEAKTDKSNYQYGDFDDYKKSMTNVRTNTYPYCDADCSGGADPTRNSNNGNHYGRRADNFNSYDNNRYSYSGGRNNAHDDLSGNRRTFHRRNFSSSRDDADEMNQDEFDRKGGHEYKNNSGYSNSVCVKVENLPAGTVVDDVKRFFSPLPLNDSAIKLQFDGKGSSARNAFVKLSCFGHKLQAIKCSGRILRGFRVSVSDIDSTAWESAKDDTIASINQQFLKISFIPKRAKKQDFLDAFPHTPDDLILMKDKNKDSLIAYVKFADSLMVKNTLADRDRMMISDSRVKLEPISEEDFLVARADYQLSDDNLNDDVGTQTNENVDTETSNKNSTQCDVNSKTKENAAENKSNCVLMKYLPSPVTDLDIINFFSDINILPSQIHIMFDGNYKQTGDSFCEFYSEVEAAEAVAKKNNAKMKYKSVTVEIVPKEEVLKVIGNQLPEEPYSKPRYNNVPPSNPKSYPPRFTASAAYGDPRPRPFLPRGPPAPPRQPVGPENFGKPGCVVSLENVPYKAEVDDILQFFSQFNIQKEHVIRRFNENGFATGDARVCLESPNEAQKAVQYLDGKSMRGRNIFVRLV